jgi:HPt (histidine-containing phosphotransfer) domain-containing protein
MFTHDHFIEFLDRFSQERRAKIRETYIKSIEDHCHTCRAAINDQNTAPIITIMHDLKSLCLMIGAQEEGEKAAQIEADVCSGTPAYEDAAALLKELENILEIMKQCN